MNTDQMIQMKKELGLTNEMISDKSGVPLPTVEKIFSGKTKNPRFDTREALEVALLKFESDIYYNREKSSQITTLYEELMRKDGELPSKVSEASELDKLFGGIDVDGSSAISYSGKYQGEFTLEDYYIISEERRIELIDGVIYDMAAPSPEHQLVIAGVVQQMKNYKEDKGLPCIPFGSPTDVRLDMDDNTMLEPDVFVLCFKDDIEESEATEESMDEQDPQDDPYEEDYDIRYIDGAPDLVMEVLSKHSIKRDTIIKYNKYYNAGVREYWVINPYKESIIKYDFEHGEAPEVFTFADKVPVMISGDQLFIDFVQIKASIEEFNVLFDRRRARRNKK